MEKQRNPFDDYLKESLKGHRLTPRDEARKAFLEEAATVVPARKAWFRWYYLPLIMICITAAVWFIYSTQQETRVIPAPAAEITVSEPEEQKPVMEPVIADIQSASAIAEQVVKPSVAGVTMQTNPTTDTQIAPFNILSTESVVSESVVPESVKNLHSESSEAETIVPASAEDTLEILQGELPVTVLTASSHDTSIIQTLVSTDTVIYQIPAGLSKKEDAATKKSISYFTVGVVYTPELMFNTIEGNKYVSNVGIEASFYRGLVSIRTGAGISISKGVTENSVEYNSFLGTYNRLDSISFSYNETNGDFIPNLYLSEEKVWDEESAYDSLDIVNRYTYLQFPLAIGFDFWHQGRFSAGVRVGTIMSVLLASKQLTGEYDPGENQLVGVDALTPDRVSINWQATGGISASAILTKRLLLELEPQAKYYYGSIYEDSGKLKKPWSVGVKLGISYKF